MAQSQLLTDPNAISGVHEAFGVDDNPHSIFRSHQELVHYASIRDMTGSEVAILKTWEPRLYYQKANMFLLSDHQYAGGHVFHFDGGVLVVPG